MWTLSNTLRNNQLYKLDDIEKILEKHKLPKVTHEEIENLNRSIISKEIDSVI